MKPFINTINFHQSRFDDVRSRITKYPWRCHYPTVSSAWDCQGPDFLHDDWMARSIQRRLESGETRSDESIPRGKWLVENGASIFDSPSYNDIFLGEFNQKVEACNYTIKRKRNERAIKGTTPLKSSQSVLYRMPVTSSLCVVKACLLVRRNAQRFWLWMHLSPQYFRNIYTVSSINALT